MDTAIKTKKFEQIVIIKLKSWTKLTTIATMEQVTKILNDPSKNYIIVDGVGFNRVTSVDEYYPYRPNEMESFIIWQSDRQVRKELQEIRDERNQQGRRTNWPSHLREIYQRRHGLIE